MQGLCLVLELHGRPTGDRLPGGTFSEHVHPCLQADLLHSGVGRSMRSSSSNAYLFLKDTEKKSLLKFKVCFARKLSVSWYEGTPVPLRKSCKVPCGMTWVCRSSKMMLFEMLKQRAGKVVLQGCKDNSIHCSENAFTNRHLVFMAEKGYFLVLELPICISCRWQKTLNTWDKFSSVNRTSPTGTDLATFTTEWKQRSLSLAIWSLSKRQSFKVMLN